MDYNQVKELINIIEGTDFTSFSLTIDGVSVAIERGQKSSLTPKSAVAPAIVQEAVAAPVTTPVSEQKVTEENKEEEISGNFAKSPLVGTFYQSSSPDKAPFVKVGDTVKKGDVLCIVEAMKFMNEVTSEYDGTVAKILVNDGDMVEYGQPLFIIQ